MKHQESSSSSSLWLQADTDVEKSMGAFLATFGCEHTKNQ
jgi:hypothetical protein